MHRYQTRLHLNYQRALHNMLLLRAAAVPNEPSPICGTVLPPCPEHSLCLPSPVNPPSNEIEP
jgi:hypothetical protein